MRLPKKVTKVHMPGAGFQCSHDGNDPEGLCDYEGPVIYRPEDPVEEHWLCPKHLEEHKGTVEVVGSVDYRDFKNK